MAGTFLPEASFVLQVLPLPVSVCVDPSVCQSVNQLVCIITHHLFKLGSPNLDLRCKRPRLIFLLFCGAIDIDLQGQIEFSISKFTLFLACGHHNSQLIEAATTRFGQNMQKHLDCIPILWGD